MMSGAYAAVQCVFSAFHQGRVNGNPDSLQRLHRDESRGLYERK